MFEMKRPEDRNKNTGCSEQKVAWCSESNITRFFGDFDFQNTWMFGTKTTDVRYTKEAVLFIT